MTTTAERPPYKIRKRDQGWCLSKWVDFNGLNVELYVGCFRTHPVAIAVMDADMAPDTYPLYNDLREI